MLVAVNEHRSTHGLSPMCSIKKLHDSDQLQSDEVAAGNNLGSQRSTRDEEDVMVSSIDSPGHLVIIMGEDTMFAPEYTCGMDIEDQHFWTRDFANSTESVGQVQTDQEPEGSVVPVSMYSTPEAVVTSVLDCHHNFQLESNSFSSMDSNDPFQNTYKATKVI
ncbi:hypothetical protein Plhal304r1_c021g0074131 [Plasmopara halstedii]